MNELNDAGYRTFVQNVIDNIKKNGFPQKKVSFDIEKLYEAASKKDINLNKVLITLEEIQIAHEKTPEKIVFFPKDKDKDKDIEIDRDKEDVDTAQNPIPTEFDVTMFKNLDPSMFGNFDLSNLKGMNMPSMMGAVAKMMKNMSPEQMDSIKNTVENLTDEQKQDLMDKASKLGFPHQDKDDK